jgi:hypothetical protein
VKIKQFITEYSDDPQVIRLLILCSLVYIISFDNMNDIPVPNGIFSPFGEK